MGDTSFLSGAAKTARSLLSARRQVPFRRAGTAMQGAKQGCPGIGSPDLTATPNGKKIRRKHQYSKREYDPAACQILNWTAALPTCSLQVQIRRVIHSATPRVVNRWITHSATPRAVNRCEVRRNLQSSDMLPCSRDEFPPFSARKRPWNP